MEKIIAIVQARMTSTRLPQKVLKNLAGRPVVSQVFNQLSFSKLLTDLLLATSLDSSDDPLEKWAVENGFKFFRGDLKNVLKRFYDAAKQNNADVIVRITADCPLIDPGVVDKVIEGFLGGKYDYFSNVNPPTFPDGLDTEVFSFTALEKAFLEAEMQSEIEHVTPYIRNHPDIFRIGNYSSLQDYSKFRWTLDNIEDYEFLKILYKNLYKENNFIRWQDVIEFIKNHSNILKLNAHLERNEGYIKSLNEDKKIK